MRIRSPLNVSRLDAGNEPKRVLLLPCPHPRRAAPVDAKELRSLFLASDRIPETYALASGLPDAPEEYERQVRRAYSAVVQPGDVAVDVGAHTGKHTIPLTFAVGIEGTVYAAEPLEKAFQTLSSRATLLEDLGFEVRLFNGALLDDPLAEHRTFSIVPDHLGWSALEARVDATDTVQVTVPTTTLDELVEPEHRGRVSFIKLDCEGAEFLVLDGGTEVLSRSLPVCHIELSPGALEAHGKDLEDAVDFMWSRFLVLDVLGFSFPDEDALAVSVQSNLVYDYICVHRDHPRRDELVTRIRDGLLQGFPGLIRDWKSPTGEVEEPKSALLRTAPAIRSPLPTQYPLPSAVPAERTIPSSATLTSPGLQLAALDAGRGIVHLSAKSIPVALPSGGDFVLLLPEEGGIYIRLVAVIQTSSAVGVRQTLLSFFDNEGVELVLRIYKPSPTPTLRVELIRVENDDLAVRWKQLEVPTADFAVNVEVTQTTISAHVDVAGSRVATLTIPNREHGRRLIGRVGGRVAHIAEEPFRGELLYATQIGRLAAAIPANRPPWVEALRRVPFARGAARTLRRITRRR